MHFLFHKIAKNVQTWDTSNPLVLKAFTPNEQICPIKVLKEYVKRTKSLRERCNQLLISYQQPHRGVKTDTISRWTRWLKEVLKQAGIDNFTGHSSRAAASSAAKRSNVDLVTILGAAGWSKAIQHLISSITNPYKFRIILERTC